MRRSGRVLFFLTTFSLAVRLLSCADADGTDPYAYWKTFVHADDMYCFCYLAPPWELFEPLDGDADVQIVAVEAAEADMDVSLETGALHARFKSVISLREDTSAAAESSADAARLFASAAGEVPVTPFENARGQNGYHLNAELSDRGIRAVYFDVSDGYVVVMQLAGREGIGGEDFTLLLKSLSPKIEEL